MNRSTILYRYAQRKNIDVDWFPMQTAEAFSIPVNGSCAIAIDPKKITSTADEVVKVAHELGHCMYGGFYCCDTPLDVKEQHEYKANAWATRRLIPWSRLKAAVLSGKTEPWELAEHFEVTESFIRWTLEYYLERKQYTFD